MSQISVSAESMLFNVGAETGVLGGLMLDNDRWDEIAPLLNSGDFYYGQHQLLFREIERLVSAGQPIDLITLSESMERKGLLERCGASLIWPNYQKHAQRRQYCCLCRNCT